MADELALLHQHQLEAAMAPSTPKRKRAGKTTTVGAEAAAVPKFSFRSAHDDAMDAAAAAEVPEGCQTPRSSMAMRFRGLALEGGGDDNNSKHVAHARRGVNSRVIAGGDAADDANASAATATATTTAATIASRPDSDDEMADASQNTRTMRKRQRVPRAPFAEPAKQPSPSTEDAPALSSSPVPVPIVPFAAGRRPSLQRSLPSINRLPQPKMRPGQAPSPPAETTPSPDGSLGEMTTTKTQSKRGQRQPKKPVASKTHTTKISGISPPTSPDESCDDDDDELAAHIVDPLRASLTWHEDEITVYDPDDSDDDGLGFDGVGFKPSPLVAEARAAKRRQQLLEYRRREESEARDRRSQRRRTAAAAAAAAAAAEAEAAARVTGAPSEGEEARRVRFMDVESCAC